MKYLFLLMFSLVCTVLPAQTMNFLFKGTITNHFTVKPEANSEVAIVQNGSKVATVKTDASGNYTLRGGVSIGSLFYVVFSKPGMVEKRIEFDFTKLNEEDVPAGTEYQPVKDLSSSIINDDPKYNVSFLKTEPVAKLTWNDRKMLVEINEGIRENMRKKIETALKDAGPKQSDAAKYQAAIAAAQSFEKEQKYEQAISKYEEALTIRPTEKMPSDKIVELSAILAKSQKESAIIDQGNQQYMNLIVAAKALADQKKYQQAIDKYNEAIAIKDDQGLLDQVKTLKGYLLEAENEQKYKDAIASADMFYNQKSYKTAKDKYTLASKLKPSEQHPKTRLADIDKKMSDLLGAQEKKKQFDDLVNEGDALFKEEKWSEAKVKYTESLKIESGATYSLEQVKDCDIKLKEITDAQEKIANIQKWLKEGDDFFKLNKWVDSKQKFTQVIGVDPENSVAKAKLIEISAKIDEETKNAALNAQIAKLILDGDGLAKSLKLQESKDKYNEALKLKSDPLVQQKIEALDKQLKEIEDKKAKESEFLALKTEGMKLATDQKWEEAKTKLSAAKVIKTDPTVDAKLAEIELKIKTLENQAKLDLDYKSIIAEAVIKETANDFEGALIKYKSASAKKPTEKEALDKIKELQLKISALEKEAQNSTLFTNLVVEGDAAFSAQKLTEAKVKFEQALKLKNEPSVVTKLENVNAALQAEKAKEEEFLALKTEGLKLHTEQKWEDAKLKLTAAKNIKADLAIDSKLAEIEIKLKALEGQAKLESEYKNLLSEAGAKETANDIDGAIAKCKEALTKKPTGKEALDKIKALDTKKAAIATVAQNEALFSKLVGEGDIALEAKRNNEAKLKFEQALKLKNDPALVSKLENINALLLAEKAKETEFLKLKTEGLKLATEQKWEEAKTNLSAAILIKADPVIDVKLAEIEAKLKALEGQAKLDSEYKILLSEATVKETANDIDGALAKYKEALTKKATGKEAIDKIKELESKKVAKSLEIQNEALVSKLVGEGDAAFAAQKNNEAKVKFEQALKLKSDPAIIAKLENVNAAIQVEKAKETEFLVLKAEGFKMVTEQKWEEAKTKLVAAKTIKADASIDAKLIEVENNLATLEGQAKIESEYKSLLSQGASKEAVNDVDGALEKYKEALAKKPSGKEAKDKISEIEGKRNAAISAINEKFTAFVNAGDALVQQKKYLEAVESFEKALKVKENEKVVIDKIAEAQRLEQLNTTTQTKELLEKTIIAAQSNIDKNEYSKAKEILTRPFIKPDEDSRVKKMLEIIDVKLNKLNAYTLKINDAERKVIDQDYRAAISLFEEAKLLNPLEKMPQKRIDELKLVLNKEVAANEKNKEYLDFIAKGDEQKNNKKFKEALSNYNEALKIKSNDQVVIDKIKEVNQILDNELALKKQIDLNKLALKKQIESADKLFQSQKFVAAKEAYLLVQQQDPSNDYVNKQLELIEENIVLLNQKKSKQEFDNLLSEATNLFNSKSYLLSKDKFELAKGLQPSNSIVISKLKEIDEILNPPLSNGELRPLGEIFDGTILDGFAALQKAEELRRYKSSNSLMDGVYTTSLSGLDESSNKDLEHYQTNKKIEKIIQDNSRIESTKTTEEDAKLTFLQNTQTTQLSNKNTSLVYITNDQFKLSEKIISLQEEGHQFSIDKMTTKQEELYSLKDMIDNNSMRVFVSTTFETNENVKDDKVIQGIKVESDSKLANYLSENQKEDVLMQTIKTASYDIATIKKDQQQIKNDDEYQRIQNQQKDLNLDKFKQEQNDISKSYETSESVSKSIVNNDKNSSERMVVKSDLYEKIKSKQNDLAVEKNELSQNESNEATVINSGIENQKTKQQLSVSEKNALQDTKAENLKKLMNAQQLESSEKSQKNSEKHYNSQVSINSAEQNKTVKNSSPNELGKTYEEGVTEESFAQKDDKGLMKAFITRRVVVIEGRGVVFIRTQTVHATTFTKDNTPITESAWQKETQDPKLVKHKK